MNEKIKSGQVKGSGIYLQSKKQWNPFVGCDHGCIYCLESFQKQYKRRWSPVPEKRKNIRNPCKLCYDYEPHEHPERLKRHLPRTKEDEFIFTVSGGDISFASKEYIERILTGIMHYSDRKFLIQTKNLGELFSKIDSFSNNVYLDITLETNRDEGYRAISKRAPLPSVRFKAYVEFQHHHKFLTIEPIFDFDEDVTLDWVKQFNPESLHRYESKGVSKKCRLPEPSLAKTQSFIKELQKFVLVYVKILRKAWWE